MSLLLPHHKIFFFFFKSIPALSNLMAASFEENMSIEKRNLKSHTHAHQTVGICDVVGAICGLRNKILLESSG